MCVFDYRLVEDRTVHEVRKKSSEGEDDAADVNSCSCVARHFLLLHHQQHPTKDRE